MKSNSKEVKLAVQEYIKECINFDGYDGITPTAENVYKQFVIEHGHNIKTMGEQRAFTEWLRGLPSVLSVACYYDEVRDILINRFKTNTPAKRDDVKSFDFFLYLIYVGIKDMINEPKKESARLLKKIEKTFK